MKKDLIIKLYIGVLITLILALDAIITIYVLQGGNPNLVPIIFVNVLVIGLILIIIKL